MIVTVSGPLEHRCPYRPEQDYGTVTITYDPLVGGEIELHELAALLATYRDAAASHETVTEAIAATLAGHGATVVTRWRTAGLDVECAARG